MDDATSLSHTRWDEVSYTRHLLCETQRLPVFVVVEAAAFGLGEPRRRTKLHAGLVQVNGVVAAAHVEAPSVARPRDAAVLDDLREFHGIALQRVLAASLRNQLNGTIYSGCTEKSDTRWNVQRGGDGFNA